MDLMYLLYRFLLKTSDDETHTLEFGAVNDMTSNCYMTIDKDTSKIYMVASDLETAFNFNLSDLAEKESLPVYYSYYSYETDCRKTGRRSRSD